MHPITRENALPLNLLPTLLLAVVLSKLPTVIIQRVADKRLKHNRERLAATPPIICERRLLPPLVLGSVSAIVRPARPRA
jgi:hypothetical protein